MKYLVSLAALVFCAGVADAQCQGASCQLLNGLTVRQTTANAQRFSLTVRTQTVTQSPRVVVVPAVQTSSTTTVQVRQRVRVLRR